MYYANLKDEELLLRVRASHNASPLELELAARLERALGEIDVLVTEGERDEQARREAADNRQAHARRHGPLALVDAMMLGKKAG